MLDGTPLLSAPKDVAVASDGRVYVVESGAHRVTVFRPIYAVGGQDLGFLPGTLEEKVSPYMRPLYDGLNDMLDGPKVQRLMEQRSAALLNGQPVVGAMVSVVGSNLGAHTSREGTYIIRGEKSSSIIREQQQSSPPSVSARAPELRTRAFSSPRSGRAAAPHRDGSCRRRGHSRTPRRAGARDRR